MPEAVRRRWFGTHFFNPPRYMRLVEIIPTPETDPAVDRCHRAFRRSAAGQGSGLRARHAELHRQPHRRVHHAGSGAADAGGRPHHRRGGRAHRHGHRLAAHRNVPPGGPGGNRCAGARGAQLPALAFRRGGTDGHPAVRRRRCSSGAGWATRPGRASTRRRRTPRARRSAWRSIGRRWNISRPSKAEAALARNGEERGAPAGAPRATAGGRCRARTRRRASTGAC